MSSTFGGGPAAAAVVDAKAADARSAASAAHAVDAGAATDFWSLLVNAATSDQLCHAWLGILCQWIPESRAGVVLLQGEDERYAPAAVWPDPERDMSYLAPVAEQALVERHGVVRDAAEGFRQCAYPLLSAERTYGVVILELRGRGEPAMRETLRLLHWGAGWLVGLYDRRQLVDDERRLQRSGQLQDVLLGVLAERTPEDAVRWVVNRLAAALPCRHAMIARARGADVELQNVSGTATFEPTSNLLSAAREAMRAVVASGVAERFPPAGDTAAAPLALPTATADYCREAGAQGALVLPLASGAQVQGALLLDFERAPGDDLVDFATTVALALAPCLDVQARAERGLATHARDATRNALHALFGARHAGLKLAAIVGLLLLAIGAVVPVDYRIRAPATVEGRIQRAAVAPFDGYLQSAAHRAGDVVHEGDVLAVLDDRDLKLDEAKYAAETELAERKLREALAQSSAVAVRIAEAELAQARAELALVREKLGRVSIAAPFDGVIVKGDLSQQLGAPLEQGKVLFEIAPLSAYRVVLRVDERDITDIRADAPGALVLAGLPGARFALHVSAIAPVTTPEEGHNAFRVEAAVDGTADGIQPGMEGVGKIVAGRRSLLWIAFHRLYDWARYTAWTLGI